MDDLISRQMAIDDLQRERKITEDYMEECLKQELFSLRAMAKEQMKRLDADIFIIETLPSAQQWIPCSERLPDEGERVLATHLGGLNPNRQVIEHIYQNGVFTCGWDMDSDVHSTTFGQRFMGKVIAWMPLPEPYKEGE